MNIILALIVAIMGAVVYYEPVLWLTNSWLQHSYYKHGFFILAIAIGIIVSKVLRSKTVTGRNYIWIVYLLISTVLYTSGVLLGSNYLTTLPIFFTLLAIAYILGEYVNVSKLTFPVLLPIIAIPLPFILEITSSLQIIIVYLSTGILSSIGFDIHSVGAEIVLPNARFVVGEPSSGIQSLIALVTLMVLAIYFTKTSLTRKIVLCFLTVPAAIFGNLMRVLVFLVVGYRYGQETAYNFWHNTANVIFFVFSLLLLLLLWYFVGAKKKLGYRR